MKNEAILKPMPKESATDLRDQAKDMLYQLDYKGLKFLVCFMKTYLER